MPHALEPSRARLVEKRARALRLALDADPQTRNKRYSPTVYARLRAARAERERVTGNSERGRKL